MFARAFSWSDRERLIEFICGVSQSCPLRGSKVATSQHLASECEQTAGIVIQEELKLYKSNCEN